MTTDYRTGGKMKILISDAFDPSLPSKLEAFGEVIDDKERLPEVDVDVDVFRRLRAFGRLRCIGQIGRAHV